MKKKTGSVQYALRWRLVGNQWRLVCNRWRLVGNRWRLVGNRWRYRANSNILPKYLIPGCFFLSAKKTRNAKFLNNSAVRDTGFRKKK